MVEFSWWAGIVGGLAGTIVMTAMMVMSSRTPLNDAPKMTLVQGAMATDDPKRANAIGAVSHVLIMGSVVFGLIYAGLFTAFGSADWWVGASIGVVHGLISGSMLPAMGRMHPRMESAAAFAGTDTVERTAGALRIMRPGPFGRNWGKATPVGFVIGHAVYGLVLALVYAALV